MVKLTNPFKVKLTASTLIEVLVSLVILLSVFVISMILFGQLTIASPSQKRQEVKFELQNIANNYVHGLTHSEELPSEGLISYWIEEEAMENFNDRLIIKVVAFDNEKKIAVDSLKQIIVIDED